MPLVLYLDNILCLEDTHTLYMYLYCSNRLVLPVIHGALTNVEVIDGTFDLMLICTPKDIINNDPAILMRILGHILEYK